MIDDKYFKSYVKEGYLSKLDDYVGAGKDESFSLEDMWPSLVNRFSYNPETGYSGTGGDYYAIPSGNSPSVLYYNATLFKEQKVNVISVEEDKLDAYNSQNASQFLPHGFYVYDIAPAQGLTARADGKYYVFNNQIPTNWTELVELSKLFTKSYNASSASTYGFLNEWWFSFGWSVGGDCLEWDEEKGQYVFNLGDETPNYLVTGSEGVTVDKTTYKAGDLLSYADKKYVAAHASDATIAGYLSAQKLYKLPSIKDAFAEFCRLSQTKSKVVTGDKYGYGVSPSPTTLGNNSKTTYFTTGEVAHRVREPERGAHHRRNHENPGQGVGRGPALPVSGVDADGRVKTVNGTRAVGKEAAHSYSLGYAIPANAKTRTRRGNSSGIWPGRRDRRP